MTLCAYCGVKPVRSPKAKYCEECRRVLNNKFTRESAELQTARRHNGYYEAQKAKPKPVKCVGCRYYRFLSGVDYACHYAIDTGKLRKIPAKDCYKHDGTPYEGIKCAKRK